MMVSHASKISLKDMKSSVEFRHRHKTGSVTHEIMENRWRCRDGLVVSLMWRRRNDGDGEWMSHSQVGGFCWERKNLRQRGNIDVLCWSL